MISLQRAGVGGSR